MLTLNTTKHFEEIKATIQDICEWTKEIEINEMTLLREDLLMSNTDIHELMLELEIKNNIIIPDSWDTIVETVGDIELLVKELMNK